MPRQSLLRWFLLCTALLGPTLAGCKSDPTTPEYWSKRLSMARRSQDRVRVLDDLRKSDNLSQAFLPLLHEQLQDTKSPEVRSATARVLATLKSPTSVEPITQAIDLGASDSSAQRANTEMARALGEIGDARAAPVLLSLLRSPDNFVRLEAITSLGQIRARDAVKPLLEIAEDPKQEAVVANRAVAALGDIGDPSVVPVMVRLLFEERGPAHVRQPLYDAAGFSLYQLGKPAADALLPVLQGTDGKLSAWAAKQNIAPGALTAKASQVLGFMLEKRAEPHLLTKLSFNSEEPSEKYFVRLTAADALGRLRSAAAVKPLSAMVDEPEPMTRETYLRALGRIGSHDAVPALGATAAKGPFEARAPAVQTLGIVGAPPDQAVLDKLASEEPTRTQTECAEAEGAGACRDVAALARKRAVFFKKASAQLSAAQRCQADAGCWTKALDDAESAVRQRAALEVGRLGHAAAIDALMARFADDDREVRLAALQAADWLTEGNAEAVQKAKAAVPKLQKQLSDDRGRSDYMEPSDNLRRFIAKLRRG